MSYLCKKEYGGYCSRNNVLLLFLYVVVIKNLGIKIHDVPTHTKVLYEGSTMRRHTLI